MLKISRNVSTVISIVLAIVFMVALIGAAVIMPRLAQMLIDTPDNIGDRNSAEATERAIILVIAYLIIMTAAVADVCLFMLLMQVRKGVVFTLKSVAFVRAVSWLCMLIGAEFCLLGIWFQLSFGVGFAAIFVGICLRVVKNVIEEATELKEEHELTI